MSFTSASYQRAILETPLVNQPIPTPFKNILNGNNAFYNQPDYLEATQRDLAKNAPLSVIYTWNTESKITRIAKLIFSIIIFPMGIYNILHALMGKVALLPASSPSLQSGFPKNYANNLRSNIKLNSEWKYKRITLEVDGYTIDAMITGKISTLNNGRWILHSAGNGEFYEEKLLPGSQFQEILSTCKSNGIVFNYPGVGVNSGLPNRQAMAKAYCAMLSFLEDHESGIGAKEIIAYGHSIGGGVQGDALKAHELKENIKYVFVKSRTFSNLTITTSLLTNKLFGFLVQIFGWNMDSVESSINLQAPEIIMQTANVDCYEELTDGSKVIDDGVIAADASLAKALLNNTKCPKEKKVFIGLPERHNDKLLNTEFLVNKIEGFLKTPSTYGYWFW